MGSDLSMEANYYASHPQPNKAEWIGNELSIQKHHWYTDQYLEIWRGQIDDSNIKLATLLLGREIPDKPTYPTDETFNQERIIDDVLETMPKTDDIVDVVSYTVAETLEYVVAWLSNRGDSHRAALLETLMET